MACTGWSNGLGDIKLIQKHINNDYYDGPEASNLKMFNVYVTSSLILSNILYQTYETKILSPPNGTFGRGRQPPDGIP